MKTKIVFVLLLIMISGCYRPNWYRANTTYAELRADSDWCKAQTKLGASRSEMIEQYEVCMEGKGYKLKDESDLSGGGEPIRVEQKEGPPIVIDKRAKVYVGVSGANTPLPMVPQYNYFHKKDCKQLWNISTEEVTVKEAIARGKRMCPDCFQKEGPPIVIDKRAKVYVGVSGTNTPLYMVPQYNYFHKRDCKQLWNISTEEVTVEEAIARGKRMCPDCFR